MLLKKQVRISSRINERVEEGNFFKMNDHEHTLKHDLFYLKQ
jgi:hypothetical protein